MSERERTAEWLEADGAAGTVADVLKPYNHSNPRCRGRVRDSDAVSTGLVVCTLTPTFAGPHRRQSQSAAPPI
jgi:hypothetical protein